jgi:hypothetical protein
MGQSFLTSVSILDLNIFQINIYVYDLYWPPHEYVFKMEIIFT